jgi:threonine synthase
MRFIDENGVLLGLMDASVRGYPRVAGAFSPAGDADLRPAIYAPEASYAEAATSAIASLFPEEVDPVMADRLAARAFAEVPTRHRHGEDILVTDHASGPSGCASDVETGFLAGVLALTARRSGPRLLLADGTGSEGASLAEAIAGVPGLRLALLYPEGHAASGLRSQRLAREGGQVSLFSVRGDRLAVDRLIREAVGGTIGGMGLVAAGPANPARFAARIVVLAATFSILRKGAAGDFIMGICAGDGLGFAACLWAWRMGLPLKGILLSIGTMGVLGLDPTGRALIDCFDAERPGVIRSLTLLQPVDCESALRSGAAFEEEGGPALDVASSMTLVAAERALDAGLRGHARIVVPRCADPRWDVVSETDTAGGTDAAIVTCGAGSSTRAAGLGLRDARVDAEIEPRLADLERALTA